MLKAYKMELANVHHCWLKDFSYIARLSFFLLFYKFWWVTKNNRDVKADKINGTRKKQRLKKHFFASDMQRVN